MEALLRHGADVHVGSGPGDSGFARVSWTFLDLAAAPPGADHFAVVVGPREFLTKKHRSSGVGWGAGFEQVDDYLPKTSSHTGAPTGQPPSSR